MKNYSAIELAGSWIRTISLEIEENKLHLIRLFYLFTGAIFQIGLLNLVIFPYLSRNLPAGQFGEFLLLISTINFYSTVFAPPAIMVLYRHFAEIPDSARARYFGGLLRSLAGVLGCIIAVNVFCYDSIARYWNLSYTKMDFFYLLSYMFFYSSDSLLLARVHYDLNFKIGLYSRVVFAFSCLLIIPVYNASPKQWLFSLTFAPAMSCMILLLNLISKKDISFRKLSLSGKILPRMGKDYIYFFFAGLSSQVLMYSDRWIIASFGIAKEAMAYYLVAVQASLLIVFPVERLGELITPSVANLKSWDQLTRTQARKSLVLMAGSMAYILSLGFIFGYIFLKLYHPLYREYGWAYFTILQFGMGLFTTYIFSRPYLMKFYSPLYLLLPFVVSVILQTITSAFLVSMLHDVIGAAIGRFIGFLALSMVYFFTCQIFLIRRARGKTA